jgi:hypothetical protein
MSFDISKKVDSPKKVETPDKDIVVEPAAAIKLEFPEEYISEEANNKIKKKLNRLTIKGMEKISEYEGLATIESMFYLYLLKKYKSPCFLIETTGDFWEILGLNLYIREFYSEEESAKIKSYLERLAKNLVQCIDNDVNIIIIPVGLTLYSPGQDPDAHANLLIYRKQFNHIEHFEPHGQTGSFVNEKFNSIIDLFLKLFVECVNVELFKYKTPAQMKDATPIELIGSSQVCPRLRGLQSYEESSALFKFEDIESGGYCAAWSMFFTELCLKNPTMTSNQILNSLFSAAMQKSSLFTTEDYFRHIIRGYATFINEKISTYFNFLLEDNKLNITKLKKMGLDEKVLLTRKMKMIINIEMALTINPNAIDDRLKFLKKNDRRYKLYDVVNTKAFELNKLELGLLQKYKKNIDKFNSPMNTPDMPIIDRKLKSAKVCPPDKVLNPLTGRCINAKPDKSVRQLINDRKDALQQELKNKIKECPQSKVLNPLTGRCIKIKHKTIKIKKEPKIKEPKTIKNTIKQQIKKEPKIKVCPPGKEVNPKTGRCVNIKVKTRKNKGDSRS